LKGRNALAGYTVKGKKEREKVRGRRVRGKG